MASTHVTDKPVTSKTESYDDGGVREERQEEKEEEVNMVRINEGADSLTDQGSGSQEATGHQDIYARSDLTKKVRRSDRERGQIGEEVNMVRINEGADSFTDQGSGSQEATGHQDLTKKVRRSDRERGQIGDTEDSGQLEVREKTEDRVVNIYESVDDLISHDVIPGPQEDMMDNTAGSQPRDLTKKVRRSDRERGQIGDTEDSGQLEVREKTEDRVVNIYESVDDLISHDVIPGQQEDMMDNTAGSQPRGLRSTVRGRLKDAAPWMCVILLVGIIVLAVHYNSSDKQRQITHDKLQTRYNNLTQEIDHLKSEVNQLREAADKMCPHGWQKFGSRCYQRSSEEKTWEEGRQYCLKSGADLVIINRTKEQEFIKSLSSGSGASWIGLNKAEGNWTWVNGTPLTTTGYWASGSPDNNADRNCVKYNHLQGDWIDAKCEEGFRWICEK